MDREKWYRWDEFQANWYRCDAMQIGIFAMNSGEKGWQTISDVLRDELCGNEGFCASISEYTKSPENAALIMQLIKSLMALTINYIDPSIATLFVVNILKTGLNVYCKFTEPGDGNGGSLLLGK